MKTRESKCVLTLVLLATLLSIAANTKAFGRTVPGQDSLPSPKKATTAQDAHSASVIGEWQGIIGGLHLIVKIEQTADGSLTGTLNSVDQKVVLPLAAVSFTTGVLRFEQTNNGVVYEGKLSDDGSAIEGTWHQGGNSVALSFHRPGITAAKFTLKPRTIGTIAFEPCRTPDGNTEGLCGKYDVYENRQTKSGRKIALNILVLPALSETPENDAWFGIAGGPGQSTVATFSGIGFATKVRQKRDVVLVDQRGTGGSNPLPCVFQDAIDAQAMIGEAFVSERVRACRSKLENKADLTQYTTSIAADDLDDVRQALGYDKIDLFGGSYGAKAALVYLRRHGEHVRTLTLAEVTSPQYRIPLAFSRTLQESIDQLLARCDADAACNKSFPNLKKEFQGIVERLDKSPARFEIKDADGKTQTVTLSRGMFVANWLSLLYVPQIVSQFPYMVDRAYQGDWSIYGTVVMSLKSAVGKTIDKGMQLSVICAEDTPGLTEAKIRRETSGTYLGDFLVRSFQSACREWPRGSIPKNFYAAIHSDVPTLLISGGLDPATPPQAAAQQTAHDLSRSRLVVVKDGTHLTGSPCIDGLIAEFVAQGSAAGLDVSCADQIHLPPFVTQAQVVDSRKIQETAYRRFQERPRGRE